MAREQRRTMGHMDLSAHTRDVHTKHEGRSMLRDKALWVTGLVSEVNAYPILTVWPPVTVPISTHDLWPVLFHVHNKLLGSNTHRISSLLFNLIDISLP